MVRQIIGFSGQGEIIIQSALQVGAYEILIEDEFGGSVDLTLSGGQVIGLANTLKEFVKANAKK